MTGADPAETADARAGAAAVPATGIRALLSRRWVGYLALVTLFSVVAALLGWWQLSRLEERRAANLLVETNWDAPAVPLSQLLPRPDSPWRSSLQWRTITVTGSYLIDEQLLVRNRPRDGYPGFEVLVPLQTERGVFLVDRGWVPTGQQQDTPDAVPAAPTGEVTVVARLKPTEPALGDRTAPPGQVPTIQLSLIDAQVEGDLWLGGYGLLESETPPAAAGAPVRRPAIDDGPHLSYAIQWFAFAVMAFVALWWFMREERRFLAGETPARPRRRTDADEEDAILERSATAAINPTGSSATR
ncbi:MAG: SURF1 family cytochrome oxidase biogenesis protein [Microbacterium sp.]|nr:SURF1 family cytochrome oxidase biogenesis protein [Microbacterium sp.]